MRAGFDEEEKGGKEREKICQIKKITRTKKPTIKKSVGPEQYFLAS